MPQYTCQKLLAIFLGSTSPTGQPSLLDDTYYILKKTFHTFLR